MEIFSILLHVETYLGQFIQSYGQLVYILLFVIIFAETGFVVTPFLPGDSLLFIVGTLAANGYLNILLTFILLSLAAILGNTVNYWLGRTLGARVFAKENSKIFNKAYLEKTREFYDKYGGKAIILSRYIPIVRTFAPFVAGIGKMKYSTFQFYNVIGGVSWVGIILFAGYFFGALPIVQENFEKVIFIIIFVSLLPAIIEFIKHRLHAQKTKEQRQSTNFQEVEDTFKEEHLKE